MAIHSVVFVASFIFVELFMFFRPKTDGIEEQVEADTFRARLAVGGPRGRAGFPETSRAFPPAVRRQFMIPTHFKRARCLFGTLIARTVVTALLLSYDEFLQSKTGPRIPKF